ncbi:nitroimidazol reductase NimA-like FMN-containing flavoprotein (pyridoxamine 5'-phosphate oxidase superfamily) [Dysgonomonadaceae bacterium PH5-43]|nr:nitroimidazol reductase NimA-like FMN-containing flavoprotein (pyridoxamine 5'-phosphate oxidase superfamily) [Dysgonomonadaceae bacterium PH5-43]
MMKSNVRFNNDSVRRRERLLEEKEAINLLRIGEYGVLSMVENIEGEIGGYGIPLNYVWDGNNSIYFHCAPEGYKLNCLRENSMVSFCVVGHTKVISNKFTTAYESIIVRGSICMNLTEEECRQALILVLDKYSPADKEIGLKYIEKSFHRTNIIRLDIKEMSGKTKRIN